MCACFILAFLDKAIYNVWRLIPLSSFAKLTQFSIQP
jgi:hypothetical protein